MEAEIKAQAVIAQDILDAYLENNNINIEIPQKINRVIIVASGSSYHCARYTADLFASIPKIEARAVYSGEFLLTETIAYQPDILYIFITQSGETTDTNSALQKAKEFGVKTLCITNKENSSIWNASDYKIACHAGEERSIAATKSFTSQLLCSTLLVLKFAQDRGIDVYGQLQDVKTIPDYIKRTFDLQKRIKQLARYLSRYKNIIITADGKSYALAKETALKIKETSYLNTSALILSEFMHGHVAVLNNKKSVLIYVLNDEISYNAIKNLAKIKESYNPPIFVIGNRTNQVKTTYNLNIECNKPMVLIGNKCDLNDQREVPKEEGIDRKSVV